jgi:nucleotide-binding universal stress UspA family protein
MYRKLLIANDGSEGAQAALTAAIYLAKRFRARLHMLSVEELPRFPTTMDEIVEEEQEGRRLLEQVSLRLLRKPKGVGSV